MKWLKGTAMLKMLLWEIRWLQKIKTMTSLGMKEKTKILKNISLLGNILLDKYTKKMKKIKYGETHIWIIMPLIHLSYLGWWNLLLITLVWKKAHTWIFLTLPNLNNLLLNLKRIYLLKWKSKNLLRLLIISEKKLKKNQI